ncbi:MAG: carboxypeptidase regulatory-like domain-containing protein [Acidobacteriia bacterium]|nr:carboxypeptidase regulatory-like domain-containing protein [Terriglobia bacterium]
MWVRSSCLALFFALVVWPVRAQTSRGTVSGLVWDPQNLAVPAAVVELTNADTNSVRSTTTNDAGFYRFDAVDPGSYKLTFRHDGFKAATIVSLEVNAGLSLAWDAHLEIGPVQEVVEVSAEVQALQADAPVRGGSVLTQSILDLPYASRNPALLALTLPGVVSNKFSITEKTSFAVNGARTRSNNFMMDGTDNNDISTAGPAFEVLNPGSVEEVSVQTTNYDSEFGRAGGAVVNVITKSGTSQWHGTAGFVLDSTRDDAISSSLSQSPAISARGHNLPGTEQRFDGSLGGPIHRDDTFFHLSYMELRQFSTSTSQMVAPTAAGRATLQRIFPPGASANADLLQQITSGYDGQFQTFSVPLGNGRPDVEFGNLIIPYSQRLRIRQYGAKIDHHFSDKDTLSGRFFIDDQFRPQGGESIGFPSFFTSSTYKTTTIALYHTHVFSPELTNELRPGFTRFNYDAPLDPVNPLGLTLPQITIAGVNSSGNFYGIEASYPQGRLFNNYTLQDTMSIVQGKHSYRFGSELVDQRARQAAPFNYRGRLTYGASSGAQNFSGLANFLDDFGGAGSTSRTFGNSQYYPSLFRQGYFFQDRWRMSPNLTMSLGLRYEYFGTPTNVTLNPVFTGLFNVDPVTLDSPLFHANQVEPDRNNWAPSVGLAYSPSSGNGWRRWLFGDHKSSIRLGYGIGYDSYFNNITSNIVAGAPASATATPPSTVTADAPRGAAGLSKLLPTQAPALTTTLAQFSVYKNLVNPYYQHWSVTLERELPLGILLDLAYVGSKGTKLFVTEDGNPLVTPDLRVPVPANVTTATRQLRVDQLQGQRLVRTNGGSSTYHAAQMEVKRRFSSGFTFSGAYTFSKLIDNASEIFTLGGTSTLQNASVPAMFGGLQIDKGISFFDRTHRAVFTYSYELPIFKPQQGILGHAVGGWQIAGLTTYESGVPYTVLNGQDADGIAGATYDRPNFNPQGRPGVRAKPDASSPTGYVNPDNNNAPIDPREARYIGIAANTSSTHRPPGNLGRNTERGPGLKNWDLNVIKNTRINEHFSLEFRSEFYNIFNTPMYGKVSVSPFAPPQDSQTIDASVFNSAAGRFLNARLQDGGGRVIRWQLRLHF